jgi:hypothetical protein
MNDSKRDGTRRQREGFFRIPFLLLLLLALLLFLILF